MSSLDQLTKIIDQTEFSDRVKDKIKELSIKAKLRKESGEKEEKYLDPEEVEKLTALIKADMVLNGLRAKACRTYLGEIERIITTLKK